MDYVVHVVVLYDGDHDGDQEGVGQGRVVEARQGGEIIAVSLTNEVSDAGFVLPGGFYRFSAWVPSTRLFYNWVCNRLIEIDSPEQYIIISCFERFFLQFPFVLGGD